MARKFLVGRCRLCRTGQSTCCRPRVREARGRQRPTVCSRCRVDALPNESTAVDVALKVSLASGTPHLVYPCPTGRGYHTTPTTSRRSA